MVAAAVTAGTLIVADNVVRNGTVLETDSDDDYAIGITALHEDGGGGTAGFGDLAANGRQQGL